MNQKTYKSNQLPPLLKNKLGLKRRPTTAEITKYAEECGAVKKKTFNEASRRITDTYEWSEDNFKKLIEIYKE